jgi:hypothetical protein
MQVTAKFSGYSQEMSVKPCVCNGEVPHFLGKTEVSEVYCVYCDGCGRGACNPDLQQLVDHWNNDLADNITEAALSESFKKCTRCQWKRPEWEPSNWWCYWYIKHRINCQQYKEFRQGA